MRKIKVIITMIAFIFNTGCNPIRPTFENMIADTIVEAKSDGYECYDPAIGSDHFGIGMVFKAEQINDKTFITDDLIATRDKYWVYPEKITNEQKQSFDDAIISEGVGPAWIDKSIKSNEMQLKFIAPLNNAISSIDSDINFGKNISTTVSGSISKRTISLLPFFKAINNNPLIHQEIFNKLDNRSAALAADDIILYNFSTEIDIDSSVSSEIIFALDELEVYFSENPELNWSIKKKSSNSFIAKSSKPLVLCYKLKVYEPGKMLSEAVKDKEFEYNVIQNQEKANILEIDCINTTLCTF